MLKSFFSLLLIFIFLIPSTNLNANYSYQSDLINQKSADGKKQGKWIIYGKDRPDEGFPANGKIEEGDYKNGRRENTWVKYHKDGVTPRLVGQYQNNRPNGKYAMYHPNGKLAEKGSFMIGKYSDTIQRFHTNGQLSYESAYNNGRENGKVIYFFPNGKIEFEYTASEGVAIGKAVRYYPSGDIKEILEFDADGSVKNRETKEIKNTKEPELTVKSSKEVSVKIDNPIVKGGKFQPNGYNKVYNTDDEIWQDGDFKDGRLFNGKVYVYDRDGILLKVKVYKEGYYHSDGQL
jgi:antitoxin component YwqK of YwqJK toxin-antitoxin module